MRIHKFTDADGFVAIDLEAPEATAIGIVRRANKVLQGGAQDLARSLTYGFASHELQLGGASAGLNGFGDGTEGLIPAFQAETAPLVAAGTFLPDAGKGVTEADVAPLRAADPRAPLRLTERNGLTLQEELVGHSVTASASVALSGDLDGKTATIEGFDVCGIAVSRALDAAGVKITGLSTGAGSIHNPDGLDAESIATAIADDSDALASFGDVQPANRVFGQPADLLTVASKMGCLNHFAAEYVKATAVVPAAPATVTAKALAMLRRAGVVLMPDFVSTGGPITVWTIDAASRPTDADAAVADAIAATTAICADVIAHDDGPFLGACYRAEAFLATWQSQLPFGRPLAP